MVNKLSVQNVLIEKIQNGLADSKNYKINSKEEARRKLSKWLK